jgi:hypothetical protein
MFRILALDGGGIKGTFSAAVLDQFEEQLGKPVIEHFDLVVGTSTGGIIALGLACGIEASRMLALYRDEGDKVFPSARSGWTGMLERIFSPKYDSDGLREILQKYLPNRRFMELEYNLAITSFDAACARPVVFKTCYHPSLLAHTELGVVDVALATSAAPTYFAGAKLDCGVMVDGGVWANCPVMVGITEALSIFRQQIDDIAVLSIGTTSIPAFVRREEREGGLLHWARPTSSLLMHAAKLGAIEQAQKLCSQLIRIDEVVDPNRFTLDDVSQVDDLAQLGWTAGRKQWNAVNRAFFSGTRAAKHRVPAIHSCGT